MKICVFGDSIGKGIIFDAVSKRYKSLKLDLLEPLRQYKDVSVKNYSMFGCTINRGLALIERYADELAGYDHILLEFGGNDCNFPWKEIAEAPEKEHLPNNSLEIFTNVYKECVERIQKAGAKPILLTLPPLDAKRFFPWVSQGLSACIIQNWLGDIEAIYRWQEMYSIAVLKLGKMLNVPVIDIRSEFLCGQNLLELICMDGMHPTSKGYELIVKAVCEQLA